MMDCIAVGYRGKGNHFSKRNVRESPRLQLADTEEGSDLQHSNHDD